MAKSSGAQSFVTSNSKLLTYALVAGAIYIAYRRGVFARLGSAISGAAASIGSGVGSRGATIGTGAGGTVTTSAPSTTPTTTQQILAATPRASSPTSSQPVTFVPSLPSTSTDFSRGYTTPIIESSDSKPQADPWSSPSPFYGVGPDALARNTSPSPFYGVGPDALDRNAVSSPSPFYGVGPDALARNTSPSPYYGPAPDAADPYHSYGAISTPAPAVFYGATPDARDRNLAAVAEAPVYQASGSDSQRDPGGFTAYDPHFMAWVVADAGGYAGDTTGVTHGN